MPKSVNLVECEILCEQFFEHYIDSLPLIMQSSGLPPSAFPIPYDSFKGQVDSHSTDLGVATPTDAILDEKQKDLDYDFICFFLSTSRTDLYRSIDFRCEDMISGEC